MNTSTPIIEARDLTVGYGSYVVQKDLNFTINRQDVFIIMGPSVVRASISSLTCMVPMTAA